MLIRPGKIKQVTDPTGSYGFAYDNMGRLIGTTTQYSFLPGTPAPTFSNSYAYDAASNRPSFTAPDGSTNTYSYDTLGRLTALTNSLTGQFGFSYDALSRRTGLNRPNGVNTTYGYDSLSRLLNVLHKAGTVTLDGAGYAYDNAGNRTAKTNYLNNITEQYTYDPLYQLSQVTQGTTTTESYSYDAVGNRLSSLGMSPYAYNSSNELTSTPNATFTYDGNGNTLTKIDSSGTTTYNWDFENRLTSVVLPGTSGTVAFKYDPLGRRVQKNAASGTTNYLYDGGNSVAEVDAAGTFLATYVQSGAIDEPLAQLRNGAAGYYEQDGLGSVTSIAGTAGTQINSDTYDSFGNLTGSTGSFTNPFQYTGRDNDSETGLLYYRTRYYDPGVARFISEDPMGFETGTNFYSYVAGNPISFTDPTGLCEYQKPKARPKRRPCRINIGIPAHVEARDEETQRILAAAGINLEFVGTNQNPDFALEYKDLSSMRALGYAGAGPNLIELDGPAIYRKGAGLGASNTAILVAAGVILAHELGHKLIGPGHADAGIMRPGFDIGDIVFQGMDMGGGLFFTPAQIPIILHKCREIRRLHPLSK